jgi:hypothetical protein
MLGDKSKVICCRSGTDGLQINNLQRQLSVIVDKIFLLYIKTAKYKLSFIAFPAALMC